MTSKFVLEWCGEFCNESSIALTVDPQAGYDLSKEQLQETCFKYFKPG